MFSAYALQMYRRTHIWKCDVNKVAMQLYWNHAFALLFSCKSAVCLQNTLFEEPLWVAAGEKTYGSGHALSAPLKPCGSQDYVTFI